MKKINVVFIILFSLMSLVFVTLVSSSEISDYDIVSGVAIDKADDNWQVTCEICKPSANDDFASKSIYVKGNGYTLEKAFENASEECANELYVKSVQIYLINRNLKDDKSVFEYFKTADVNMRAIAVYTDDDAFSHFETDDDENERAKSIALVKKIKRFSDFSEMPNQSVVNFLKNSSVVSISHNNSLKRGMNVYE